MANQNQFKQKVHNRQKCFDCKTINYLKSQVVSIRLSRLKLSAHIRLTARQKNDPRESEL